MIDVFRYSDGVDVFGDSSSEVIDLLDLPHFYTFNDYVNAGGGKDLVYGGDGNDTIEGGKGYDTLVGEVGHDFLNGQEGNDVLVGGGFEINSNEQDTLIGGKGADVFVLGDLKGAYYQDFGKFSDASYATIKDFDPTQGDLIQLFGSIHDYELFDYRNGVDIVYKGDLIGYLENLHTTEITPDRDFLFV